MRFHQLDITKEVGVMKTEVAKRLDRRTDKFDQMQFKIVFLVVFSWFLLSSLVKTIMLVRGNKDKNCWKEAAIQTNSVVPYLFMQV